MTFIEGSLEFTLQFGQKNFYENYYVLGKAFLYFNRADIFA